MTADERLNQLEPTIAEILKQQEGLGLQNQALLKMFFDITITQMEVKREIGKTQSEQNKQGNRLSHIEEDISQVKHRLAHIEEMVTAIFNAVQKPSGN